MKWGEKVGRGVGERIWLKGGGNNFWRAKVKINRVYVAESRIFFLIFSHLFLLHPPQIFIHLWVLWVAEWQQLKDNEWSSSLWSSIWNKKWRSLPVVATWRQWVLILHIRTFTISIRLIPPLFEYTGSAIFAQALHWWAYCELPSFRRIPIATRVELNLSWSRLASNLHLCLLRLSSCSVLFKTPLIDYNFLSKLLPFSHHDLPASQLEARVLKEECSWREVEDEFNAKSIDFDRVNSDFYAIPQLSQKKLPSQFTSMICILTAPWLHRLSKASVSVLNYSLTFCATPDEVLWTLELGSVW